MDPQHGLEVESTEAWTEDQLLFVQCVHDILSVDGGPDFHVIDDPLAMRGVPADTLCIFVIETNPLLDLSVSIEIGDGAMRLRVNGVPYAYPRKPGRDVTHWIDRCCRTVERLIASPDLKIETSNSIGITATSTLYVRRPRRRKVKPRDNWRKLGEKTAVLGVVASALGHLIPFAIIFDRDDDRVCKNWYGRDVEAEEAQAEVQPESESEELDPSR